jgi:hypothetical protein
MKPIFRSFFSSGPFSCAMACSAPSGSTDMIAARAVLAPTARRKLRRTLSIGNSAFMRLASSLALESSMAPACSPGAWSRPQAQRITSGRSAS